MATAMQKKGVLDALYHVEMATKLVNNVLYARVKNGRVWYTPEEANNNGSVHRAFAALEDMKRDLGIIAMNLGSE